MASTNENTSSAGSANPVPAAAAAGNTISATAFQQMLTVLSDLAAHNHIFYDDYTTVCECQCQCNCSRGTL